MAGITEQDKREHWLYRKLALNSLLLSPLNLPRTGDFQSQQDTFIQQGTLSTPLSWPPTFIRAPGESTEQSRLCYKQDWKEQVDSVPGVLSPSC